MKYISTILLSFLVLYNMIVSHIGIDTPNQWYWWVHTPQIGIILIAAALKKDNKVNDFIFWLYLLFFAINKVLFVMFGDHADWGLTALSFAGAVVLVLIKSKILKNGD